MRETFQIFSRSSVVNGLRLPVSREVSLPAEAKAEKKETHSKSEHAHCQIRNEKMEIEIYKTTRGVEGEKVNGIQIH